ncbi:hypothetical protein [Staphylococcus nepalensis]|uniref:hypothetical protein n=1 Tax=Staphylococcus nepalensis TaxID=214473 RepID=UPI0032E8E1C4
MFVLGGVLSQIGISLILAIIVSAIILVAVMYAVAPLTAIDNNVVQAIAGIIFFGLPTITFIVVFILSLTTDYS